MISNKSSSAIASYLRLVFISLSSIFVSSNYAVAQIIPDNTLGNERSQVQSNFQIRGINSDIINGGARRGSNLFHSFREFNIDRGRGAYFFTSSEINNILTRVTGGNVSNIFGTLGVLGNANLYLINPNGIYFGNGAKLDIRGSFTATTADGIRLGETGSFSAVNPGGDNLLTVQPGALFTNTIRNSPREIIVDRGELISTNDIAIDTDRLKVVNGGFIFIVQDDNFGIKAGSANLNLKAKSIKIDGANGILTGLFNFTDNTKNSGDIIIDTKELNMTNGARIENRTFGAGAGGNLTITTDFLSVNNGAYISVSTFREGNGGNLTVNAQNINLDGSNPIDRFPSSGLLAQANPGSTGAGGNLTVNTNSLTITNGAQISASTFGKGNAGSLTINAQNINLDGLNAIDGSQSRLLSQTEGTGAGGNLTVNTNFLSITNGAQISASTFGKGNAGSLTVKAQNINLDGSFSGLFAQTEGTGAGGNLTINTNSLTVTNKALISARNLEGTGAGGNLTINTNSLTATNKAQISASTFGDGNAGSLTVKAQNIALDRGSGLFIGTQGKGAGGNLKIDTNSLSITRGAQVSGTTSGEGNGGNITVNAQNIILEGFSSGLFTQVNPGATGAGGNLSLETNFLSITNGAQISTNTFGVGNAGNLTVKSQNITLDGFASGLFARVTPEATGAGGNLSLDTNSLSITNGAQISASTFGGGNAGNLTVKSQNITLDGSNLIEGFSSGLFTQVTPGATGAGGNLSLETNFLSIINGAVISASTLGGGNAGNLIVKAQNITLDGFSSGLFARVTPGATGAGGNLSLETNSLSITNEATISASTFGGGNAGNLTVKSQNITLDNSSGLFAQVDRGATGAGGNLAIDTNSLSLTNGAQISASTFGGGNAGNLTVKAQNITLDGLNRRLNNRSGLFVATSGAGAGGNIEIETSNLNITEGAEISATSFNEGNAGNINLNVDNLNLNNEGKISSITSVNSSGDGGNISIAAKDKITLQNNSTIEVSNLGTGKGGQIDIQALSLALDRGLINAESNSKIGGNININLDNILTLKNFSRISATSGIDGSSGDGGNIKIASPLILAFSRNNEIVANAYLGQGGNININTNAIFGYPQFLNITASSNLGIDGTVAIEGLKNEEISKSTTDLPIIPIDAEKIIANDPCEYKYNEIAKGSSFTIIGRGGIAPNPIESLEYARPSVEWSKRKNRTINRVNLSNQNNQITNKPQIQEAKGWFRGADGTIILTANPNDIKSLNTSVTDSNCQ